MGQGHAHSERPSNGDMYVLPRHPAEIDRLDVQHYAMRSVPTTSLRSPVRPWSLTSVVALGNGPSSCARSSSERWWLASTWSRANPSRRRTIDLSEGTY